MKYFDKINGFKKLKYELYGIKYAIKFNQLINKVWNKTKYYENILIWRKITWFLKKTNNGFFNKFDLLKKILLELNYS